MSALAKNQSANAKGGGGDLLIKQVVVNDDGTISELASGTDVFGEAFGTWHQIGSLEETSIERNDTGGHKLSATLIELDEARKNFLINAAPFSTTSAAKKEELILEDGTVVESADGESFDNTRPAFQVIKRHAPIGGKENAFFGVVQVSRAGGRSEKANARAKCKFDFNTIDANGYVCTKPATPDWCDDLTAPTLSNAKAHGINVFEA